MIILNISNNIINNNSSIRVNTNPSIIILLEFLSYGTIITIFNLIKSVSIIFVINIFNNIGYFNFNVTNINFKWSRSKSTTFKFKFSFISIRKFTSRYFINFSYNYIVIKIVINKSNYVITSLTNIEEF
jgi:hypothetical protein